MLVSSSEVARLHPDRGRVGSAAAEPVGGGVAGSSRRGRGPRPSLVGTADQACSSGSNEWIDYVTGHGQSRLTHEHIFIRQNS